MVFVNTYQMRTGAGECIGSLIRRIPEPTATANFCSTTRRQYHDIFPGARLPQRSFDNSNNNEEEETKITIQIQQKRPTDSNRSFP